jgi:acetyl/propionyl-CoA carboxylase alpha subunit
MADQQGNIVHLFERECSLQRRYQKIIEEAPSGHISVQTRKRLTEAAIKLAREIGYTSAGTVEFLLDKNQNFYFMEMNTRIQVEHPATELITGLDLVKEQISVAQGKALSFTQDEVTMKGHAIEARLYAEDPVHDFLPSSGILGSMDLPSGKKLRIDNGFYAGNQVTASYDPLLAKVLARGKNREDARKNLIRALKETRITGLQTNREFLLALLKSGHFQDNKIHTRLLDSETRHLISSLEKQKAETDRKMLVAVAAFISLSTGKDKLPEASNRHSPWHQTGHWRMIPEITLKAGEDSYDVRYKRLKADAGMQFLIGDREFRVRLKQRNKRLLHVLVNGQGKKLWAFTDHSEIHLDLEGMQFTFRRPDILDRRYIRSDELQKSSGNGEISAPLNGKIVEIPVKEGDRVAEGTPLVIIESMKMENKLLAENEAIVKEIKVDSGQQVQKNQILLTLDPL